MMGSITTTGLWIAAIGAGVMAGVFFVFSAFGMRSLAAISNSAGIAAMQSINEVIVASPFLPLFMGTSLLSLVLAGQSLTQWGAPGAAAILAGGVIYFVGMFVCTAVFNVPLNNELAVLDPESAQAATVWPAYVHTWSLWNHVRTVASTVACGAFIFALVARG